MATGVHTVLNLTFFAGITPGKHEFLARSHLLAEKQFRPRNSRFQELFLVQKVKFNTVSHVTFWTRKMLEIFAEVSG